MPDLSEAIKQVKESENVKRLLKELLAAQQEDWKEKLVGAYGEDIAKLQGAIIHTRILASQLEEFETTLQEQSYI